ncbi:MAG: hypothetical protein V1746_05245 [bacterium]
MTNSAESWGVIAPLAQKVCKNEIDGFELPFETINFAQKQWPDGRPVVRHPTPSGFLLFVEGAHENYGFASVEDFRRAARKRLLKAKTPQGAISLGQTRATNGQPMHIAVTMRELNAPLRFVAEPGGEAQQICDILTELFPQAKVQASSTPSAFWFSAVPSFPLISTLKKLNTLLPRQQKALLQIYSVALINLIVAWSTLFNLTPLWISMLFTFAFLFTFVLCFSSLRPDETPPPQQKNRKV